MTRTLRSYLALGALALGFSGAAQALPVIRIVAPPGAPKEVQDNSSADLLNLAAGEVSWSGAVTSTGSDQIATSSTGLTKPSLGSSSAPSMNFFAESLSRFTGTLILAFSESGYSPLGTALAEISGSIGQGSITYATYWSSSNILFATDTLLTSQTFTRGANDPAAFMGTASGILLSGGSGSLTQIITITHTGTDNFSFNAKLAFASAPVPDAGSTATLLGAALGTLGLISRRRKSACGTGA